MSEEPRSQPFLSPAILTTLLKCHCGMETDSKDETNIKALICLGVVYEPNGLPSTTPLGDAWVRAILKTNIPRAAFVNEQGEIV